MTDYSLTADPFSFTTTVTDETLVGVYVGLALDQLQLNLKNGDLAGYTAAVAPSVADTLNLSETLSSIPIWGASPSDGLGLSDVATPLGIFVKAVTDGLSLNDAVLAGYAAVVADTLDLSDSETLGVLATYVADLLKLSDSLGGSTGIFGWVIAETLGLADVSLHAILAAAFDLLTLVGRPAVQLSTSYNWNDNLRLHDSIVGLWQFAVFGTDELELSASDAVLAIYQAAVSDTLNFGNLTLMPGDSTTWAINSRTGAVTEYRGWNFNSFVRQGLGGFSYLAAADDGLYQLAGDTDNATKITAQITGGIMQFTGANLGAIRAAYIAMRGEGDVFLKLTTGDGVERTYKAQLNPMRTARVDMGKGLRARYFAWSLEVPGQDFDFDSLEFLPIASARRV